MINIKGKKISIIGAKESGVAAARLCKMLGAIPFVSDCDSEQKLIEYKEIFQNEGIDYELGSHTSKALECDFIVTSPGVPSNSEILTKAKQNKIRIVSEIEFASWFCNAKIISITGTNGKTTTTSLCAHTLKKSGYTAYAAGNIGKAFSDLALNVSSKDFIVLETSSFQLDFIENFKPAVAVILNITPDHLDRYNNSFDEYRNSKYNVTKNQDENDLFVFNADDENTYADVINKKVKRLGFSLKKELLNGSFYKEGKIFFAKNGFIEEVCNTNALKIKGMHNVANALAVVNVAKMLNISNNKIRDALFSFEGVEHRLEFVREINGVKYINDSKATNVDSVWYALESFSEPIYLILGGKDKGNDYNQIRQLVKTKVKKIYAIGSSAQKIYDYFKDIVEVEFQKSLEESVLTARKEAQPGTIVLLSPACASFDMFENFEHRGNVFKQVVNGLV
ncbi:UDP-N-acetylmuramoyl-L-alanine--D-glutamate ligase [Melioribacteraceae bacterium 4301-Me]|uniref:UDP-N-acetylmuramoyl-L-alanine--D-glutamate ligase n=1 Tax=Pyranulibacter aquaticus TaxID=3163344 RepID=UPI0035970CFF